MNLSENSVCVGKHLLCCIFATCSYEFVYLDSYLVIMFTFGKFFVKKQVTYKDLLGNIDFRVTKKLALVRSSN